MLRSEFDYDDILDALHRQDCVLFIGPNFLKTPNGCSLEKALWEELDVRNPDHPFIRSFYEDDGFFLLREENHRRRLVRRIRRYYAEPHAHAKELLKKLARIPFPLFFLLNHDQLLHEAFGEQKLDYCHDLYFMGQPFGPYVGPGRDRPLLYHMLGNLENPESLVLTHKDLFNYLKSIFAGRSMAPELRKTIQDVRTFVFLGLPFEKWYMQLLLRVLYHISSRLESLEQYASANPEALRHFLFEEEFKIKFVPEAGDCFVEELFTRCREKGLLREKQEENHRYLYRTDLHQATDLISKNHIEEGIDVLRKVLRAHQPLTDLKLNELGLYQQSYYSLQQKVLNGMAHESDRAALNQTIYRCISLVSETQKLLQL